MSVFNYITFPIEVTYEDVLTNAISSIQAQFPGYVAAEGNLDTAILEAWATEASQLRTLASGVPDSIFRWFGATMVGIPPIDATPASVATTWTLTDTNGHTIPAGTQVSIPVDADTSYLFETVADITVPVGSTTTAAGEVIIVAVEDGAAASNLGGAGTYVTLEDPLTFVSTIQQTGPTSGGADAEDDTTYFGRLREELTLLSPRLIIPNDFAVAARSLGAWRALAVDLYNPLHNLLNANDASFETSVAGYTGTNATLAQSAAQAEDLGHSMSMTSVAAGTMSAQLTATDEIAVTPGDTITVVASFRSAATPRPVRVGIDWFTSGGAFISETAPGTVNDTTTGWTQSAATGVAPPTAAYCRPTLYVTGPTGAGEVHYVDEVSVRRGTTTDWVAGGTAETNVPKSITTFVVDSNGNPLSSLVKSTIASYFSANREVNFLGYVADPAYVGIDVTFAVKVLPDFDPTAVATATEAAVSSFLSPANSGVDTSESATAGARSWISNQTVRYLDLAAVIHNVAGVQYITSLQLAPHGGALGTADVALGTFPTLTTAGTIIGAGS